MPSALSLVRSKAREWDLDPRRLGMIGFSAGAHLALATATSFDTRMYEPFDSIDRESCRPDFAIALYPGYLLDEDRQVLVPSLRIAPDTPPVFLAHADDDRIVTAENSVLMYLALKRAGVSAELQVYATGGTALVCASASSRFRVGQSVVPTGWRSRECCSGALEGKCYAPWLALLGISAVATLCAVTS